MSDFAIAILEDDAGRIAAMKEWLDDRFSMYEHVIFESADRMIDWLALNLDRVLIASLDHDLEPIHQPNPGTGRLVADYLATKSPRFPIILHSTNRPAVAGMKQVLEDSDWLCSMVAPYDDLAWISETWWPTLRQQVLLLATKEESHRASA
jgi:hypothetical protein